MPVISNASSVEESIRFPMPSLARACDARLWSMWCGPVREAHWPTPHTPFTMRPRRVSAQRSYWASTPLAICAHSAHLWSV